MGTITRGVWYRGPFEHNGSIAELEDWFDPARLRDNCPTGFVGLAPLRSFGAPLGDQIQPMSYAAVQSMLDGFFPSGHQHYWKSNLTSRVPDEVLEIMVDFTRRKPSSFTIAGLQALHGVAGRVPTGDTAFAHRGNRFDCMILSQWSSPAGADRNISWTKDFYARLEPHVDTAVYVNNLGDEPDVVVRDAFGKNYGATLNGEGQVRPDELLPVHPEHQAKP